MKETVSLSSSTDNTFMEHGNEDVSLEDDGSVLTSSTTGTTSTRRSSRDSSEEHFKRCLNSSQGNGKGRTWEQSFAALVAYKDMTGHTNCPYYYENDRSLGDWVNRQRKEKNLLTAEQREQLTSIGFDWSSTQERLCKLVISTASSI